MNPIRKCALALLVSVTALGVVDARKVWTPETGEVTLEEMPRNTPEQRRKFAFALMGAGQVEEGTRILNEQIDAEPDAEWVPRTRLAMGRALLDVNLARQAFRELEKVDPEQAGEELLERVRQLQFQAARVRARQSLSGATAMLDEMMKYMETDEERAFVMKEKADVARLAGHYLAAMGRYMEAIDAYPRSTWVPYCEYGIALSQWQFADWLSLGLVDVTAAEQSFEDFIEVYPSHPLTPEARKKLQHARRLRRNMYEDVSRFYAERENKPWAALRYLNYMLADFADLPEGELWEARFEARRYRDDLSKPLPGKTWDLNAPGLITSENEQ